MNELIEKVKQWGINKGIMDKGTLLGQLSKTQEELNETRDAAVLCKYGLSDYRLNQLKDGIGDTTVTLILAAAMAGLDFEACLQHAYDEIKDRTGVMVNGQFIKDK